MLTWTELRPILFALRRWWWVIVVAVALSVGSAFLISMREQRYYSARATLMIGTTFESTLPDPTQLQISYSLVRYYGELARRQPILESVVQKLQLPFPWYVISDVMLRTSTISSANLLEITITDSNPQRAAAIANAIGDELIAYSPAAPDKVAAAQTEVNRQIEQSEARIQEIKNALSELEAQRSQLTSATDLADLSNQIAELERSLQQEESSYQVLFRLRSSSIANSLSFFEVANPPSSALPSRRATVVGIAGAAGLMLALMAVFLLDRVDVHWRGVNDVQHRLRMRSLGSVPAGPPILALEHDTAISRELAVRETHTNLLLTTADSRLRTLLVASPSPSEDRPSYAIDLAYLFAKSGYRVLIVDADIDHAQLTSIMDSARAIDWNPIPGVARDGVWTHIRATTVPNLMILPGQRSGQPMPTLVPSLRWPDLVRQLAKTVDITIVDASPVLLSADAALLAPHVDGVILTLDPHHDTRDLVDRARDRLLNNPSTRLAGAVMVVAASSVQPARRLRLPTIPIPLLPSAPAHTTDAHHEPLVTPSETVSDAEDRPNGVETIVTPPPSDTIEVIIEPESPQIETPHPTTSTAVWSETLLPPSTTGSRRRNQGRRTRTSGGRQRSTKKLD